MQLNNYLAAAIIAYTTPLILASPVSTSCTEESSIQATSSSFPDRDPYGSHVSSSVTVSPIRSSEGISTSTSSVSTRTITEQTHPSSLTVSQIHFTEGIPISSHSNSSSVEITHTLTEHPHPTVAPIPYSQLHPEQSSTATPHFFSEDFPPQSSPPAPAPTAQSKYTHHFPGNLTSSKTHSSEHPLPTNAPHTISNPDEGTTFNTFSAYHVPTMSNSPNQGPESISTSTIRVPSTLRTLISIPYQGPTSATNTLATFAPTSPPAQPTPTSPVNGVCEGPKWTAFCPDGFEYVCRGAFAEDPCKDHMEEAAVCVCPDGATTFFCHGDFFLSPCEDGAVSAN